MKASSICVLAFLLCLSVCEHAFDDVWVGLDTHFRSSLPDIVLRNAIKNAKLVQVSPTQEKIRFFYTGENQAQISISFQLDEAGDVVDVVGEINDVNGETKIIQSRENKFDLSEGEQIELFVKENFGPHLDFGKLVDVLQKKEGDGESYVLDFCPDESKQENSLIYEIKIVKEQDEFKIIDYAYKNLPTFEESFLTGFDLEIEDNWKIFNDIVQTLCEPVPGLKNSLIQNVRYAEPYYEITFLNTQEEREIERCLTIFYDKFSSKFNIIKNIQLEDFVGTAEPILDQVNTILEEVQERSDSLQERVVKKEKVNQKGEIILEQISEVEYQEDGLIEIEIIDEETSLQTGRVIKNQQGFVLQETKRIIEENTEVKIIVENSEIDESSVGLVILNDNVVEIQTEGKRQEIIQGTQKMITQTIKIKADVNEKKENVLIRTQTIKDEKDQLIRENVLIAEPEIQAISEGQTQNGEIIEQNEFDSQTNIEPDSSSLIVEEVGNEIGQSFSQEPETSEQYIGIEPQTQVYTQIEPQTQAYTQIEPQTQVYTQIEPISNDPQTQQYTQGQKEESSTLNQPQPQTKILLPEPESYTQVSTLRQPENEGQGFSEPYGLPLPSQKSSIQGNIEKESQILSIRSNIRREQQSEKNIQNSFPDESIRIKLQPKNNKFDKKVYLQSQAEKPIKMSDYQQPVIQVIPPKEETSQKEGDTNRFSGRNFFMPRNYQIKFRGYQTDHCVQYFGPNCVKCAYRFFLNDESRCEPVQHQCKTYNPKSGQCFSCYKGYYLKNSHCLVENPLCLDSDSDGYCTSCFEGYQLVDGKCRQKSDDLCSEWDGGHTQCLSCKKGCYFDSSNSCKKVDSHCVNFNYGQRKCQQCEESYVPENERCFHVI